MDREERSAEHPAQNEMLIAAQADPQLRAVRADPGRHPARRVRRARSRSSGSRSSRAPTSTTCASWPSVHGYVFYVTPGPGAVHQLRVLGPADPRRAAAARDHGEHGPGDEREARRGAPRTGSGPTMVEGEVQDRSTNQKVPVRTFGEPAAAAGRRCRRGWSTGRTCAREQLRESGANAVQAMAQAQGAMEATTDAVKLEGELDAGSYGGVLQARGAGRRARRGLQLRRLLLRQAGDPQDRARPLHAAVRARARGPRLDDPDGAGMSEFYGKYRGKVENNVDPLQQGRVQVSRARRAGRRPAELGDAVRAVRRVAGRACSRCRRSARTSGSSSRRQPRLPDLERLLLGHRRGARRQPGDRREEGLQDRRGHARAERPRRAAAG